MKLEDLYLINKEVQEKSENSFPGWVGSLDIPDTFPDSGGNFN